MKAFPNSNKYPDGEPDCNGMDLRDHFAGLAMQGIVASFNTESTVKTITKMGKERNESPNKVVAEMAYEYADAMMEARNA